MKKYLFMLIVTSLLAATSAQAQDEIIAVCEEENTAPTDHIVLGCVLSIEQAAPLPNISSVGFDQRASGYYRHCWDTTTETYQYSPWYDRSASYPSSGAVSIYLLGQIGVTKLWNGGPEQAHWDPVLENRAQFWYVESSVKTNYGSPVTNSMTWTPSPCT